MEFVDPYINMRHVKHCKFLNNFTSGLPDDEDFRNLYAELERHSTHSVSSDRNLIGWFKFTKASQCVSTKFRQFFSPLAFVKLLRVTSQLIAPSSCQNDAEIDSTSCVCIDTFFTYVIRKVWLLQSWVRLSACDTDLDGYLTETELEQYIAMVATQTLSQCVQVSQQFYSYYSVTVMAKFLFVLDPMKRGRVAIKDILASGFLDDLVESREQLLSERSSMATTPHQFGLLTQTGCRATSAEHQTASSDLSLLSSETPATCTANNDVKAANHDSSDVHTIRPYAPATSADTVKCTASDRVRSAADAGSGHGARMSGDGDFPDDHHDKDDGDECREQAQQAQGVTSVCSGDDQHFCSNLLDDSSVDFGNWFSVATALCLYGQFANLDTDCNGMLSRDEFIRFDQHKFTRTFVDRLFQCILTYESEMDYKAYLEFVLAVENKQSPQAIRYFFRVLDLNDCGYLTGFNINYFFKEIQESLNSQEVVSTEIIVAEIYDMICPTLSDRITVQDLMQSTKGSTVIEMLIDVHGFCNYENREVF